MQNFENELSKQMEVVKEQKRVERESRKPSEVVVSTPPEELKEEPAGEPEELDVVVHIDKGTQSSDLDFLRNVVLDFFPGKEVNIKYRALDGKYEIEVLLSETKRVVPPKNEKEKERTTTERDVRSFTVDKSVAEAQIKSWCQKIKDNSEGKPTPSGAIGISSKKSLPEGLGSTKEFFFRE